MNRRRQPKSQPDIAYNQVPPQAKDLEEIVLGAIMLVKTAFDVVATILKPESFYVDAHQRVFRCMTALSMKAQPIDMMTVAEALRASGELETIGGPVAIMNLTNRVTNSAHLEAYCHIIHEKWLKREQIRVCSEGMAAAYDDGTDAFESLDTLSGRITQLATIGTSDGSEDMAALCVRRVQYLEAMRHRDGGVLGVPTGFKSIDDITCGWIDTDLIILAARPSVGKTAFALNLARNAAANAFKPTPAIFFSLEMSKEKLTDRVLSAETGISIEKITKARLSDAEMEVLLRSGSPKLSSYPLTLEYCPSLNIIELRAKVRRWLQRVGGHGLVVIDYLQLMSGVRDDLSSQNREQEIATISRGLKSLAGEMRIPIIALSQMSRDVEKNGRGGKAKLSDLRESGAIEQDADVVAFLSRADYEMAEHEMTEEEKGKALINFKKNRQGRLDIVPMRTVLEVQRWMELDEYQAYQLNLQTLPPGNWRSLANEGAKLYIQSNADDNEYF